MDIFEKLIQTLKRIPPKVKEPKPNANSFKTEMASEFNMYDFEKVITKDMNMVALELFKIIEDIEQAEQKTPNSHDAFRSIVKELTKKRFLYLDYLTKKDLEKEKIDKVSYNE